MYSALINNSSMVADKPLFKSIGLLILPNSFNKSKFCIFLAPTWIISAFSINVSISYGDISSVTIGNPVLAFASFNNSKPSYFNPWKLYGEVLGLNAPPLKKLAPCFFTSFATSAICSLFSTEQGPAITAILFPPIVWPLISITVFSGWNNLFAFLKGSWTCITLSTLGLASIYEGSILVVSPTNPNILISVPVTGFTVTPRASNSPVNFLIASLLVFGFNITTI